MNYLKTRSGLLAAHTIDLIRPPLRPVGGEPFNYQTIEYHVGGEPRETVADVNDVLEFLEDNE